MQKDTSEERSGGKEGMTTVKTIVNKCQSETYAFWRLFSVAPIVCSSVYRSSGKMRAAPTVSVTEHCRCNMGFKEACASTELSSGERL